jgi:aryl-alcohol dehydrogenase-like predicted oxidoreductase
MEVSSAGLGTMTFGGAADESASRELLDMAWDAGVNLVDTANMYNAGRSEEIVGRWVNARGVRDQVVLASKVRYAVGDDSASAGLSPTTIVTQLEASLRRLSTEYLDVYYLHQPDDDVPIESTLGCLQELLFTGKIRHIGLSNFAAWQVVEAIHTCRQRGWTEPVVVQPMYNVITRTIETELLPMARSYDLAVCSYNPLAGGLLSTKHGVDLARAGTRMATNAAYRERYWSEPQRHAVAALAEVAARAGRSLVELALRFVVDSTDGLFVLMGARTPAQLRECLMAIDGSARLTTDERAACDSVWNALRGPIPRYNRSNADV